jgi:hypothetical protein
LSKNLKRSHQQLFRVDDSELALIKEKMAAAKILNKEAYFRRMVLDGYVLRLDFSDVRKMIRLQSNACNNLNQIARRINQGGGLYAKDIQIIRTDYERLWPQMREVMTKLSRL